MKGNQQTKTRRQDRLLLFAGIAFSVLFTALIWWAGRRLEDAYAALGVSKDASDAEVKRAYRKLIGENHPDKLAARGLPESMRAVAEERSREINAAYDLIKEARGM